MSTVQTKLQQLADQLTAEEIAELEAIDTESPPTALSPALHGKLEQAARDLTEEERAWVRNTDPEVTGHMIKQRRVQGLPDSDHDGIPDGAGGGGGAFPGLIKKGINRFIFHQNTNPLF
jgi:hypothetical protein